MSLVIDSRYSHLDHGLTQAHITWLLERFSDKTGFFIETLELPGNLGSLVCGLHGPVMGDVPIADNEVEMAARGERAYPSRLVARSARPTRQITIIAGPADEGGEHWDCLLYTSFGGPLTPREPGDPTLREDERQTSIDFWKEHALSR